MRPATTEMWGRRLLWFVGLWAASILVLGVIAMVLRAVLKDL
ncbi:DUF2474 family protein [Roseomonas harenae]|nr:DUF2474 family protein [Roseomonas harenae]